MVATEIIILSAYEHISAIFIAVISDAHEITLTRPLFALLLIITY
jgi:hypothetical protein